MIAPFFGRFLGRCGPRSIDSVWKRQTSHGRNFGPCSAQKGASSYGDPRIYDISFSFRDFESEAAFLLEVQDAFGQGPMESFLEIGCGPARHSMTLAEAGIRNCVGIDLSRDMISYASKVAEERGVSKRTCFIEADMASPKGYADAVGLQEFQLAAIMLGTYSHCLSNEDAIQTLKNVAM